MRKLVICVFALRLCKLLCQLNRWRIFSDTISLFSLTPEEALAEDLEPSSPIADGMTIAERDIKITEVITLCKKLLTDKSYADKENVKKKLMGVLEAFQWKFVSASTWAHSKWWKYEKVLLAPYAAPIGKCVCSHG